MKGASAPKLKLAAEKFHVHSFVVVFYFYSCGDFEFWFTVFDETDLTNERTTFFKKNWSNKNVSNFVVYTIKFTWFNKFDQINLAVY